MTMALCISSGVCNATRARELEREMRIGVGGGGGGMTRATDGEESIVDGEELRCEGLEKAEEAGLEGGVDNTGGRGL